MAINIRAYSRDSDTSVGNAIIQQHHAPPGFSNFSFRHIIHCFFQSQIRAIFVRTKGFASPIKG